VSVLDVKPTARLANIIFAGIKAMGTFNRKLREEAKLDLMPSP